MASIALMPDSLNFTPLYFALYALRRAPGGQFIDPFFGPIIELLMINYLAQGYGLIIHACGIEYDSKGMLFAGESGAEPVRRLLQCSVPPFWDAAGMEFSMALFEALGYPHILPRINV